MSSELKMEINWMGFIVDGVTPADDHTWNANHRKQIGEWDQKSEWFVNVFVDGQWCNDLI